MLLAISWGMIGRVVLTIFIILLIIMVILYFMGRRLQNQQAESQSIMEANTMDASILVIDKKKMRIKEAVAAGVPDEIQKSSPFYLRFSKLPVVKAKVGPRVMTLIADPTVFEQLPLKKEVKVSVAGLYIRSIKSVRGGTIVKTEKKRGFFARLRNRAQDRLDKEQAKGKKK